MRIAIDTKQTRSLRGEIGHGPIVARFVDDETLYRVIDGRELRWALRSGVITGGVFSVSYERRFGASWATGGPKTALGEGTSEEIEMLTELIRWGLHWQAAGRLGKDLYLLEASGRGRTFFHLSPKPEVSIAADAPEYFETIVPARLCNTGLGCSTRVGVEEARVYAIDVDGKLTRLTLDKLGKIAAGESRKPIEVYPIVKDISWGGQILGRSVLISRDQGGRKRFWRVFASEDDRTPVVDGATTPKNAAEAAVVVFRQWGQTPPRTVYLNRRPVEASSLSVGDRYENSLGRLYTVRRVGAGHVELQSVDDKYDRLSVELVDFFKSKRGFRRAWW